MKRSQGSGTRAGGDSEQRPAQWEEWEDPEAPAHPLLRQRREFRAHDGPRDAVSEPWRPVKGEVEEEEWSLAGPRPRSLVLTMVGHRRCLESEAEHRRDLCRRKQHSRDWPGMPQRSLESELVRDGAGETRLYHATRMWAIPLLDRWVCTNIHKPQSDNTGRLGRLQMQEKSRRSDGANGTLGRT